MKKKLFIVFLMLILCTIIVNLSYDFFMDDRLVTIREKLTYRKIYAEREILENINGEKELSHNDIKITLENNSYDKETGKLKATFKIENMKNQISLLTSMIRVHDNSNVFYNYRTEGNEQYVDDIDYFVYKYKMYSQLSTKGYKLDGLNDTKHFFFYKPPYVVYDENQKEIYLNLFMIDLDLDLGKGYEIDDCIYVEFLDLIHHSGYGYQKKAFDYLGEFKFKLDI